MATIYVPEHFRNIARTELIEKLEGSGKYRLSFTSPSRLTTFPSNLHLWNGKNVVVDEKRFHFVQENSALGELSQFTKESLIANLIEIIGESPSNTTERKKECYILAIYDRLEEREQRGIKYGDIERTQLCISPRKI